MRHRAKWFIVAGILALVVALMWVGPALQSRHGIGLSATGDYPHAEEVTGLGTTGQHEDARIVNDLQAVIGGEPDEMIGRRVDLHVKVSDINNYGAFWIGTGDQMALVVLGRDNRTTGQRDQGEPSPHNIQPVASGQMAHITGTIEKIPSAEARYSWGVANPQHEAVENLKFYIRADSVVPEG